jgi:hypothetical protein
MFVFTRALHLRHRVSRCGGDSGCFDIQCPAHGSGRPSGVRHQTVNDWCSTS